MHGMKILYLVLKNFIGIYNGMGMKQLVLDFRECKSKFIVLAGENGSGKTTILSALHPFSGVQDEDRTKIIRAEKKGYKEVHILYGEFIYIIKHFYEPTKTSHTVKSFVTKADIKTGLQVELNSNGNVTSFIDIVTTELGVNNDYLKLLRMGSNMKGFIGMTATERKNYMNKFISDTEIYLKYFKKINDDCRVVKGLIDSVTEKLKKLEDKQELKESIEIIEKRINAFNIQRDEAMSLINANMGQIMVLDPNDDIEIRCRAAMNTYEDLRAKLELLQDSDIQAKDLNQLKTLITQYKIELTKLEGMLKYMMDRKIILKSEITDMDNELTDIEAKISTYNLESLNQLKDVRDMYKAMVKDYEKKFSRLGYEPSLTKEQLLQGYNLLAKIDDTIDVLHDTYESNIFDNLLSMHNDPNWQSKYSTAYMNALTDIEKKKVKLQNLLNDKTKTDMAEEFTKILSKRPSQCKIDSCAFIQDALIKLKALEQFSDIDDKIASVRKDIETLEAQATIISEQMQLYKQVRTIINMRDAARDILKHLPNNSFMDDNRLITIVIRDIKLYDREALADQVSISEDFEIYNELKNVKLVTVENEINVLSSNETIVNTFLQRAAIIKDKKSKAVTELASINNSVKSLSEKVGTLEHMLSKHENYMVVMENRVELEQNFTRTRQELKDIEKNMTQISALKQIIQTNRNNVSNMDRSLEEMNKTRDKLLFRFKQVKKFTREKEFLQDNYKDMDMLRNALSSKAGVPLVFVQLYFDETRQIANTLLKNAFDGKLTLGTFNINEKEFTIPCTGKGETNDDVSSASAGEKAMIGLSLMFALAKQKSSRYKIILLDELDAALDKKNRKLFLHLLEKQTELLNIEQIFVISHNDAFSNYDTGLILLRNHNLDKVNRKNVIFDYECA